MDKLKKALKSKEGYQKNIAEVRKALPREWKDEFFNTYYKRLSREERKIYYHRINNWLDTMLDFLIKKKDIALYVVDEYEY